MKRLAIVTLRMNAKYDVVNENGGSATINDTTTREGS